MGILNCNLYLLCCCIVVRIIYYNVLFYKGCCWSNDVKNEVFYELKLKL